MSPPSERVGILVINFGEPDEPVPEKVEPFLERIFLQNAGLEPDQEQRARARELARDRTPGLIEEYASIGGSPLNAQAEAQARALEDVLRARGWDARSYSAYQFTSPSIAEQVAAADADGVGTLVALPLYPLCGQSTTVAAVDAARAALEDVDRGRADGSRPGDRPRFLALSGWHHDPAYVGFRTAHVRRFVETRGLDLTDTDTLLYFSVHGTPIKYLEAGNRYDRYVQEHCADLARRLGTERHAVGFQNHTNRRIDWTQPDNEDRIRTVPERRLVVVPISFMHEQSETLAELDNGLRGYAEGLGKEFHRVPVPHDAAAFVELLADLVSGLVLEPEAEPAPLSRCRCAPFEGVWCTNGARDLPPSPFAALTR